MNTTYTGPFPFNSNPYLARLKVILIDTHHPIPLQKHRHPTACAKASGRDTALANCFCCADDLGNGRESDFDIGLVSEMESDFDIQETVMPSEIVSAVAETWSRDRLLRSWPFPRKGSSAIAVRDGICEDSPKYSFSSSDPRCPQVPPAWSDVAISHHILVLVSGDHR